LAEARRIAPRFNDVTTRHVRSAFECTSKSVFVKRSAPTRRFELALGLEALAILTPRRDRLVAVPLQLLAALLMVTTPEGAVTLVESNHVLDALKRTPR
jgi:hypothetical protein